GVVYDSPDPSVLGIADVQGAIWPLSQAGGAVFRATRCSDGFGTRESICKNLPIAGRLSVFHRNEDNLITLLLVTKAVPAAMESDEGPVAVFFGEHGSIINENIIRTPMSGESYKRLLKAFAAVRRLAITTVFGVGKELTLHVIVIAIRPSEIVTFIYVDKDFGGQLEVLLFGKDSRPVAVEIVTTVGCCIQFVRVFVPCKCYRIAYSRSIAMGKILCLIECVIIKLPDTRACLKFLARIIAF